MRRTTRITNRKETTARVNSGIIFPKLNQSIDLDKQIGGLSTQVLSQSPRGMQLLESIKTWLHEHPSATDHSTRDLLQSPHGNVRNTTFIEGRAILFTEN